MMLEQRKKCATMEFHSCAQIPNQVKVCGCIPDWVRDQWAVLIGTDAAEIV